VKSPPTVVQAVKPMAEEARETSEDLDIARRCVAGDRDAQKLVFAKYKKLVHGAIYRLLGTDAGIDDAIQDTFVEVFTSLSSFRGDAALGTWIHTCAVRVAMAHCSKRSRARELEATGPAPESASSTDDVALAREATRRLYKLLERLSPETRAVFVLSAIEGRPLKEIARHTGSSLVATKVRAWRARQQIETLAKEDPVLAPFVCDGDDATDAGEEEP
jgi:RNA polymerase sigma-70 factor (ECF subfamily)